MVGLRISDVLDKCLNAHLIEIEKGVILEVMNIFTALINTISLRYTRLL